MELSYKKTAVAAIAVGAFAIATASQADAASGKSNHWRGADMIPEFAELDTNGDGQLSRDEFGARGQAWFASADADGDGMLTAEELHTKFAEAIEKAIASRTAKAVEWLDDDGDGMLSVEEFQAEAGKWNIFGRLDRDEDGMVSESEFEKAQSDGRRGWRDRRHRNK